MRRSGWWAAGHVDVGEEVGAIRCRSMELSGYLDQTGGEAVKLESDVCRARRTRFYTKAGSDSWRVSRGMTN
jgi:hypothetical protein